MARQPRNLNVQTPGEPAAAAQLPNGEARKEIPVDSAVRNASEEAPASAARAVNELPDQNDVDHAKIPYGQRVMSKQGWVCSSQDPPQKARR